MPKRTADQPELGPAMQALPKDSWRRFVIACLSPTNEGTINYTQAAADAGFKGQTRAALAVVGHRLAHDERVQAAMLEESRRRLGAALPMATAVVVQIATDPTAKKSERLMAARILMDRGGLPVVTEQRVSVKKEESEGDIVERIVRLANEMRMDPRELLGQYGYKLPEPMAALPAPAEVVEDAEIIEEPTSVEGLW